MRLALLCLVVLLLAGCGRLVGMSAARRDATLDALLSQRFPLGPGEAALRLRGQRGITSRCDWINGALRCGGCTRGKCFQLAEEDGFTRFIPQDELSEAELLSIWQPIDAPSLTSYRLVQEQAVLDQLILQEERFEPRWGITGGLVAGVSTETSAFGSVSLGGRIGVRRWFDIHFIGHAAFEYRFRGEHELSLRAGLEVARWTEGRLWGAPGAPGASVSMFIGPLIRAPAIRGGLRTGVGLHLTDIRSAPFFVEAAAETMFAGEASRVIGTFTVGVGL